MNINNYGRSDGHLETIQNNGHSSITTTAYENNQMSGAIEEHSTGNQILLPEKNEHEIEQRNLESEMQISSTCYSGSDGSVEFSLENDTILNNYMDLRSYYFGKTVDIYLSVLESNLTTSRLSDKDKFWITECALRAIPFGNTDVRKWSAEDVVIYLEKFSYISYPINYSKYYYADKQTFQNFINKNINGEGFLTFNLTDLLATIKRPRRRQVLIIYGAILILRKYLSVYYTDFLETYGSECADMESSLIDQIVPGDLCLNTDIYIPVLEAELGILKLSDKDKFWITESVVGALPMFGTIDVRKWSVKEVIVYLRQLVKVSAPIDYSNNNDPEKLSTMFGKFVNEDINGVAFLMLSQRDLLNLVKPPGRRLVLLLYGAVLILKKYSEIFYP